MFEREFFVKAQQLFGCPRAFREDLAFSITRRELRFDSTPAHLTSLAQAAKFSDHPGHDCFAMPFSVAARWPDYGSQVFMGKLMENELSTMLLLHSF